jgi:hypothetical protein
LNERFARLRFCRGEASASAAKRAKRKTNLVVDAEGMMGKYADRQPVVKVKWLKKECSLRRRGGEKRSGYKKAHRKEDDTGEDWNKAQPDDNPRRILGGKQAIF